MSEECTERHQPKKFFTSKEDEVIIQMAKLQTPELWKEVAAVLYPRTPRQCRERYRHYLQKKSNNQWTGEEDDILIVEYNSIGPKWTEIAKRLPNHTPVNIKNRFALLVRRNERVSAEKERYPFFVNSSPKDASANEYTTEVTDSSHESENVEYDQYFDIFDNYIEEGMY